MSKPPSRRVLAALHPGDDPQNALDCACALAAEMGSELAGLFLEDQALFDLVDLPGVEVSRSTGALRPLDLATLERDLRAGAEDARRKLSRLAAESRVAWSFEVRRGRAGETVMEAMRSARLVVVSRGAFDPLGAARRAGGPGPVLVLLEESPGESAALDAALGAARRMGAPLSALLTRERSREARLALERRAARQGVALGFRMLPQEPEQATAELAAAGARLLVLDASGRAAAPAELRRLMMAARCDAALIGAH